MTDPGVSICPLALPVSAEAGGGGGAGVQYKSGEE